MRIVTKPWRLAGVLAVLTLLPHCHGEQTPEARTPPALARPEAVVDPARKTPGEAPCPGLVAACGEVFVPPADVCSAGGWCWTSPRLPTDTLVDAWALGDTNALAVGAPGFVLHWWGQDWRYLPSGTSHPLFAVWGSGPTDAWAVGLEGTIVHWNGFVWTQVRTGGAHLYTVFGTGPDNVWAGGSAGTLLHWDGVRWHELSSGTDGAIYSLWASGGSDVWTLVFPPGEDAPNLVRRWNGQTWSTVLSTTSQPWSLWGFGPDDVWVAGARGLLRHWTGTAWHQVPGTSSNDFFGRVRGRVPGQLWVAGDLLWRLDGETLRRQAYDSDRTRSFNAIALGSQGPVLAVGTAGAFMRYQGNDQWAIQASAEGRILSPTVVGVWAHSPTEAWVARDDGTVLRWDGVEWSVVPGTPWMSMQAISGSSPTDVWVAGRAPNSTPVLARFDGQQWTQTSVPGAWEGIVRKVWAHHAHAAWALKDLGTVLRWNGQSWSEVLKLDRRLQAVHGSSEDDVWAVGDSGALFHWNGQRWVDHGFEGPDLRAVWAFGPEDVWVAGLDRSLWHWDGQRVRRVDTAEPLFVTAFFGRSPTDLWAVGELGVIAHWDGQAWTRVPSGTRQSLLGVWGAEDHLFAGGQGTVLMRRD
ncbi:hypothetical protein [Archangium primigenium]|uniref:hypothetical protein n=1 Tax=[Archangium] primigenium TaxID=2792470 RepID=UPI00195B5498|nr:hypothetical protein [Archangium primigenium]MBM7113172.1 hypothetical protein [Archangium primigenium]